MPLRRSDPFLLISQLFGRSAFRIYKPNVPAAPVSATADNPFAIRRPVRVRVIQSIITRIQNKYNASVAEVDNQGLWQLATLGITCVSNHRRHANEMLSSMINFVAQNYPEVELLSSEIEVFSAF